MGEDEFGTPTSRPATPAASTETPAEVTIVLDESDLIPPGAGEEGSGLTVLFKLEGGRPVAIPRPELRERPDPDATQFAATAEFGGGYKVPVRRKQFPQFREMILKMVAHRVEIGEYRKANQLLRMLIKVAAHFKREREVAQLRPYSPPQIALTERQKALLDSCGKIELIEPPPAGHPAGERWVAFVNVPSGREPTITLGHLNQPRMETARANLEAAVRGERRPEIRNELKGLLSLLFPGFYGDQK